MENSYEKITRECHSEIIQTRKGICKIIIFVSSILIVNNPSRLSLHSLSER